MRLDGLCSKTHFNPRSLAGATAKFTYTIYAAIFQSSLCVSDNRHYVISIHAPFRERQTVPWELELPFVISIHTPLQERPVTAGIFFHAISISILAPLRERLFSSPCSTCFIQSKTIRTCILIRILLLKPVGLPITNFANFTGDIFCFAATNRAPSNVFHD